MVKIITYIIHGDVIRIWLRIRDKVRVRVRIGVGVRYNPPI
jgi:hypothetical protein